MPGGWDDDGDDDFFDDGMDGLDFDGPAQSDDDWSGLDALDEPQTRAEADSELSGWDAAPDYPAAQTDPGPVDFDVFGEQPEAAEEPGPQALFTVAHPSNLLSVTASISGGIYTVDLSPEVATLGESQLAQTIKATAELASLKGRSVQYALIYELMSSQGIDGAAVTQYLDHDIGLPTPQQAADAEAEAVSQYLRETHG
ncbi:hypothetical protein FR943_17990 [Mycobacterium sp. TNTM28]|uniref:Secretion protein EspD n=1 Tax=[Mycobacterium] fortunisiensis TaxID=2600579 RepID=A0ABS6KQ29_9MYCO|nr:hypothetical protein [[Mycobacterium] fortunisiensis]MBU9765727.1 hypothetical protein [[Mycobacterium] fortunisiensis]